MAKRKTPAQQEDEIQEDPEVVRGGPVGSKIEPDEVVEDELEDEDDPKPEPTQAEINTAILDALKDLRKDQLKIAQRSNTPAKPAKAADEDEEFDDKFEDELFEKPREVLKKFGDRIVKQVTKTLESRYTREQGQQSFWNEFYDKHADLKDDKDLVKATLDGNINSLAEMEAGEAADKLADLTRARILRYRGDNKDNRRNENGRNARDRVEGSSNQRRPAPTNQPPKVVTLSDIIRSRRAAHRQALITPRSKKGTAA